MELDVHDTDVGEGLKVMRHDFHTMDDEGGQKKGPDGEGADAEEQNVDGARDSLTMTATPAVSEMLLVVGTHGGRQAGYVVAPSGEDVSYHLVDAGTGSSPAVLLQG